MFDLPVGVKRTHFDIKRKLKRHLRYCLIKPWNSFAIGNGLSMVVGIPVKVCWWGRNLGEEGSDKGEGGWNLRFLFSGTLHLSVMSIWNILYFLASIKVNWKWGSHFSFSGWLWRKASRRHVIMNLHTYINIIYIYMLLAMYEI